MFRKHPRSSLVSYAVPPQEYMALLAGGCVFAGIPFLYYLVNAPLQE